MLAIAPRSFAPSYFLPDAPHHQLVTSLLNSASPSRSWSALISPLTCNSIKLLVSWEIRKAQNGSHTSRSARLSASFARHPRDPSKMPSIAVTPRRVLPRRNSLATLKLLSLQHNQNEKSQGSPCVVFSFVPVLQLSTVPRRWSRKAVNNLGRKLALEAPMILIPVRKYENRRVSSGNSAPSDPGVSGYFARYIRRMNSWLNIELRPDGKEIGITADWRTTKWHSKY